MHLTCSTHLADTFRSQLPEDFTFEGNWVIVLGEREAIPKDALAFCVAAALTHKLKRGARGAKANRTVPKGLNT